MSTSFWYLLTYKHPPSRPETLFAGQAGVSDSIFCEVWLSPESTGPFTLTCVLRLLFGNSSICQHPRWGCDLDSCWDLYRICKSTVVVYCRVYFKAEGIFSSLRIFGTMVIKTIITNLVALSLKFWISLYLIFPLSLGMKGLLIQYTKDYSHFVIVLHSLEGMDLFTN